MLTGDPNPTMARDTMFAVVMLVTNGLVGFTLLFGGWRYHTQNFNLDGVKSYLVAIIPLALLCLVLPNFTRGGTLGSMSSPMSWMLIIISVLLYGVFLLIRPAATATSSSTATTRTTRNTTAYYAATSITPCCCSPTWWW